jgi:hypothetical protein
MSGPITLPTFTFLHGPKDVGKTTLAKALFDASASQGDRPIIYHIGNPVYTIAQAVFQRPLEDFNTEFKRSFLHYGLEGRTGRTFLVAAGKFLREEVGPQYFGQTAIERINHDVPFYNKWIIDGVRFEDEILPILEAFPHHSKLFLQIRRAEHTWQGDLGAYFTPWGALNCIRLQVDGVGSPEDCINYLTPALEHSAQDGENIS